MNRWTLCILTGALALPIGLAAAAPKSQALEDAAWGASSKKAKHAQKSKKHASGHVSVKEISTVNLHSNASPIQPVKHAVRPAVTHEKPAALVDGQMPGTPVDFGTESEGAAYQKDADAAQSQIALLLDRGSHNKKPSKSPSGLAGMIQLQPKLEKALNDENLSPDERDSLRSLAQQRDTALYMLSSSLLVQKKAYAAGAYLRFLEKSAMPGTPMREAAAQQLAQLGIH